MTQDISKMAEEIYPIADTDTIEYKVRMIEKRKGWVSGYTAALTSPASGWVKASERLPLHKAHWNNDYKGPHDTEFPVRFKNRYYMGNIYDEAKKHDKETKYSISFNGEHHFENEFSEIEWLDDETPLPTVEDPGKAMKKLVWDMIEEWQMSRDKDEDINEDKFSYQDIEIDLYGWLEKIDKQFPTPKSHKQD